MSSSSDWRRYFNINEISRYADSHYREIQLGVYVIGATGVLVLVRSLRLFTKFSSVQKIPDSYFRKQVCLQGFVRSVEGEKFMLNIEHIPIIEMNYHKRTKSLLPVRLAGLSSWCEPNASKFAANQVLGKRVTFKLTEEGPKEEYLLAAIYHRPYWFWRSRSLNADMVEQGLASYIFDEAVPSVVVKKEEEPHNFEQQPVEHRLAERLMTAQRVAQKKRIGIWADVAASPSSSTAVEANATELVARKSHNSLLSLVYSSTAAVSQGVRSVLSAVVFFPAKVKDKIMEKRSIS